MTVAVPATSTIDLFSDDVLRNTEAVFAELRELAPVVYLPANDSWVVTRYEDIRDALGDPATFSSRAVAFNEQMNEILSGTSLASDPPQHGDLRAVLTDNLSPRAMRKMKAGIYEKADELVRELVERGSFDGMADMAVHFPVSIVLDLIGVQGDLRERILPWGEAAFNLLGPMNQRAQESLPIAGELFHWTHEEMRGEDLAEGSIGRNIWEAAERGDISHESFGYIVHQILAAGMDTTITTIGNALVLLARNPEQFEKLRQDPKLVPAALTEVLRVKTPTPAFGRRTTRDVEIGGTVIPEGAQVALLYGSGNLDPRKFENPETFDISRNAVDHLGFGYGIHACAGQGLAKLEIHGLLEAWATRVKSYRVGEVVQRLNNFTRPYDSIEITDLVPAGE
ncbi:cytochrome P450 [Corynebacterium halotolerans]|uniref:Cytochrome P450 n=1 Tax=Corynebacterium halotolerans YIM 70093 = DSM 44683 TaxID=1121362 RepID=M1P4M3_9CORY|nr:cytochrome P450 [Corynebacterium halotolerans]AGF71591.1 Cytochrome P450 [Corynebacterium halotolerans YIM 70093 = DSM 44683]